MPPLQLERNTFGQLVFTDATGQRHTGVVPVRAFPITAPEHGLALLSPEGQELLWIEHLHALPHDMATLLAEELAEREFMPEIRAIRHVSSFATPSTWEVDTDRGPTRLVLKGEEDIRRLGANALLIADHHGLQYLIRDRQALDRQSRKFLMRFL
ncbi:MAG: DUF1854 domain-containing protein [Azovibrio sp.]|nr:DUF1854 domain-containing protein [Azovibrio sp.]